MKKCEENLRKIAKPLTTTTHEATPLREISYAAKIECNKMIEKKVEQNRKERNESMISGTNIVG